MWEVHNEMLQLKTMCENVWTRERRSGIYCDGWKLLWISDRESINTYTCICLYTYIHVSSSLLLFVFVFIAVNCFYQWNRKFEVWDINYKLEMKSMEKHKFLFSKKWIYKKGIHKCLNAPSFSSHASSKHFPPSKMRESSVSETTCNCSSKSSLCLVRAVAFYSFLLTWILLFHSRFTTLDLFKYVHQHQVVHKGASSIIVITL